MTVTINYGKSKTLFVNLVLKMGMGDNETDRIIQTCVDVEAIRRAIPMMKSCGALSMSFSAYWDWVDVQPDESSAYPGPEMLQELEDEALEFGAPEGKIGGHKVTVDQHGGFVIEGYWDYDGSPIESEHVSLSALEEYIKAFSLDEGGSQGNVEE